MRRLLVLATLVMTLTGCASTVPSFQPDRCHRRDPARDTLNWDFFCVQSP